jgi:hypothetical protein
MPEYFYVPILDGTMQRIQFGSTEFETTNIKGGWAEALDLNLEIGIGADEVFAMYICHLMDHWSMYEYLVSLKLREIMTIVNFVILLVKTGLYICVHPPSEKSGIKDLTKRGNLH